MMQQKKASFTLVFFVLIVAFGLLLYALNYAPKTKVMPSGSATGVLINMMALGNPAAVAFLVIVVLVILMGISILVDYRNEKQNYLNELSREIVEPKKK